MNSSKDSLNFSVRNHYVTQWLQRRFLEPGSGQTKLYYLDLQPEIIKLPDGSTKPRKALRHLGPVNCFVQDHLYTLNFGKYASDVIEKQFFGTIDDAGAEAVPFFADYSVRDGVHEAFDGMRNFLAAQLFRTPKGLAMLKALSKSASHQQTLMALQKAWPMYVTIWMEAVWAIVKCSQTKTKFIISDSPVTTYNKKVFPASSEARRFGMARIELIGTHTIFPIDLEHCLVITNLQYVRNPKVDPLKIRENPRYFAPAHFDLRKIQRNQELDEREVLAINHILKMHANRYIAAAREEWLYPERVLKNLFWPHLGGKYFLHPDPRKVSFTTAIISGGGKHGSMGFNEYGHFDLDGPRAKVLREIEWKTFQAAKQAWDERDRRAGRTPLNIKELTDYI